MTYHCGIGPGLESFGMRSDVPHVLCNVCGARADGTRADGSASAWLRNGTAPKGWRLVRLGPWGSHRQDYCPRCKGAAPAPRADGGSDG